MKKQLLLLTFLLLPLAAMAHNAFYEQASEKFNKNDFRGALDDLNHSIAQDSDDSLAYIMRGACKSKVGDWDGAVADANQAVSLAESKHDELLPQYQEIRANLMTSRAKQLAQQAPTQAVPSQQNPANHGLGVDPSAIVATHNLWRAQVGVPELTYSPELAASAQNWAAHLKNENNCQMKHSGGGVGENLFWQGAWSNGNIYQVQSKEVVDAWGSEKKNYDYAQNSCAAGGVCGHYTQVVWKNTTSVGCGMVLCPDNSQIWACQYQPAGNWVGEKPY